MSTLSIERIKVQATATDKADAIRQAGELLVNTGCVKPEYVEGMQARERTMSTYLGNGVAIPHGEYENRDHVHQTGISVLQVPAGILWEEDEMAYLVIGIAAVGDEHMSVLMSLAEVIEDEELVEKLWKTDDPNLIFEHLGAEATEEA
jgi:phosphocarrier protein FPr